MSGPGTPGGDLPDGHGLRIAVVATRWHAELAEALLAGARRGLEEARVADVAVLRVPGAFELPITAQALAERRYDAVVCLGVIIRGDTPHFDYVCRAATDGCLRVSLDTGVPVGFGVLTCADEAQARDRVGLPGSTEDKGREAALAATSTALLLRGIRRGE